MKKRFTEEQIIGFLREADDGQDGRQSWCGAAAERKGSAAAARCSAVARDVTVVVGDQRRG